MIETIVTVMILCNNHNWTYSPRCTAPVEHFEQTPTGFKGHLTSGVEFTQDWVLPNMMEFKAEEMHWYITSEGIVYKN